jgi:hypothetical protein
MKGKATGGGSTLRDHTRQPQSDGHNRRKHTGDDDDSSHKKPALAGRYIASPKVCIPPPSPQHTLANTSQTRLPAPDFHSNLMDFNSVPSLKLLLCRLLTHRPLTVRVSRLLRPPVSTTAMSCRHAARTQEYALRDRHMHMIRIQEKILELGLQRQEK